MADAAELQARLDALRACRATGALIVRTADGRSVTYRSDKELAAAIADLEKQIAGGTPVTTVLVACSKGLDSQ